MFCFNLPGARLQGGDWNRLPSLCSRSHRGSARRFKPSPSPTSFAIHRVPLPSPHHVTAAWTPGLFFPSAQPHRAGASEPIHSNCVTMSPGAQRLRELPNSALAPLSPEEGCTLLGSTTPACPPPQANLRPSAHAQGVEVKLSWAASAPRRPLPPPRPAPTPHQARPPTAQPGPERSPRRLLPAPAPETPLGRAAPKPR